MRTGTSKPTRTKGKSFLDALHATNRVRAFRRNLRNVLLDRGKARVSLKIGIGPAISIFALAISAATVYFNIIRQADDLRIVLNKYPDVSIRMKDNRISVTANNYLTFINSGNRAAAVQRIGLKLIQPFAKDSKLRLDIESSKAAMDCASWADANYLEYEIEPFVVKSAEIITRQLKFRRRLEIQEDGTRYVEVSDGNSGRELPYIAACMVFSLLTPDSVISEMSVPLFEVELFRGGQPGAPDQPGPQLLRDVLKLDTPKALIRSSGTIFDRP